jgi:hypothetical protein
MKAFVPVMVIYNSPEELRNTKVSIYLRMLKGARI